MKSMKLYMPVLLLGLVSFMTGTLAAQNGTLTLPDQGIAIPSSMLCNGSQVNIQGTVNILYHRNGNHEAAHFRFGGTGTDQSNNQYNFSLEAELQYDANGTTSATQVFFFPYHATIAGRGGAPTYNLTGQLGILVVNGVPTDDAIMSAQAACN
jgi:hypothetical protein